MAGRRRHPLGHSTNTSPNRRGIVRHYEEVVKATIDKPLLFLYNILLPRYRGQRTCPELLAESRADRAHRRRQAGRIRRRVSSRSTASRSTPATTARWPRARPGWGRRRAGGQPRGGRRDAPHGLDEPDYRAEIDASLRDVYDTLFITANPICTKAALNMLGRPRGGLGCRLVQASDDEAARLTMLERYGLLEVAATLRRQPARPPLGGLGEIGKNMTVVEYDGADRRSWTSGCCASPRPT